MKIEATECLKIFSIVLFSGFAIGFVLTFFVFVTTTNPSAFLWLDFAETGLGSALSILTYYFARQNNRVKLGSWLLLGFTCATIYEGIYADGLQQPTPGLLLIIVISSLFLLPWYATLFFCVVGAIETCLVYLIDYTPPLDLNTKVDFVVFSLVQWLLVLLLPGAIGLFLLARLRHTYNLVIEQGKALQTVTEDERSRIASEWHDGVVNPLEMCLSQLSRKLSEDTDLKH
jgi:hypothetical protein